jgi:hypothetical protein
MRVIEKTFKQENVAQQKNNNPAIKTPHTGQIVASGGGDEVPVQANCEKDAVPVDFEDKISSHASVNSVNSNSDWLKDAPDDPK